MNASLVTVYSRRVNPQIFDEIFLNADIRKQIFSYLGSPDVVRLSWTNLLWIKQGIHIAQETENLDLHLRCNKSKKERDTWNAFFRRERPSSAGMDPEHIDMQLKLHQFVSFAKVSGKTARRLTASIELPFARDMQGYSRTLTDLFSTLSTFKNLLLLDLNFSDVLFLKEFSEALVICVEMEGCLCGNLETFRVSTRDRKAGPEASGILLALEKGAFPMLQNLKLSGFNLSRLHGAPEVTLLLKQALLSKSLENLTSLELNETKLGDNLSTLFESFDMVPSSRALNVLDLRSTGPAMYTSFARVLLNDFLPRMTDLGIDFQAMPTILDMLEGNTSALSALRVLNLHVELSTFPSALYITQRYHSFYDVRSCAPISARFVRLLSAETGILPSLRLLSFYVAPTRWKKKTEPPPVAQDDIDAIRYAFKEAGRQVQVTSIDLMPPITTSSGG